MSFKSFILCIKCIFYKSTISYVTQLNKNLKWLCMKEGKRKNERKERGGEKKEKEGRRGEELKGEEETEGMGRLIQ